jgi:hypothetical protein
MFIESYVQKPPCKTSIFASKSCKICNININIKTWTNNNYMCLLKYQLFVYSYYGDLYLNN